MKLTVEGMACLGSFGESIGALLHAVVLGKQPDSGARNNIVCGPKADTSRLASFFPARALRQMDHFTRMALLCACDALTDAGLVSVGDRMDIPPEMGIILVSGYGPATPTFQFLDSIIAHGERMSSPLAFSHSVHNIPAATIAMKLQLVGPCLTLCQLDCPVTTGLLAASVWLAEGRVSRILFGSVDEHTPLLGRVSSRLAEDLQRRGKQGDRSGLFLGEGAAFFALSANNTKMRHGCLSDLSLHPVSPGREWQDIGAQAPDATNILVSGMIPHSQATEKNIVSLAAQYGNIPVAQAFDAALALARPLTGGKTLCTSFGPHGQCGSFAVDSIHTNLASDGEEQ